MKDMVNAQDFLWSFYLISLVLYFLQGLKKVICMVLILNSPPPSSPPPHPLSKWVGQSFVGGGGGSFASDDHIPENPKSRAVFASEEYPLENLPLAMCREENIMQENLFCEAHEKGIVEKERLVSSGMVEVDMVKRPIKLRKRPALTIVPEYYRGIEFGKMDRNLENKEFEVEGRDFFLAGKKGRRMVMEDGYGVMTDILGDPKQAFFAVIDGHGGRAAADYVAENLGKNIVKALENVGNAEDWLEQAIRGGYLVTDKEFLSQGVSSGACASSVLLKDGELHVANVGDCRVVLSRKGIADALTNDHRLSREDERLRIESSGGYVYCHNGVWRVQGSLAVSRAMGDLHLKEWIISEPEIKKLHLTSDCEFLIMASDGLWDKVNDQEAVDVVLRDNNSLESCKKLVDISCSRGNLDDITVMVINLQRFVVTGH